MLPVNTGFIFPNGEILDTATKGHRRCAYRYILDKKMNLAFEVYEREIGGEEDDFLIECLGAIKICHYSGQHYVYAPRIKNGLIKTLIKRYKKAGFKIIYVGNHNVFNEPQFTSIPDAIEIPYSKTIGEVVINGKKKYIYNPKRIGD